MPSHQTFIVLTYVIAVLSILGSLNTIIAGIIGAQNLNSTEYRVSAIVNGLGALFFAGMLLLGLYKRRAELIRVYILYMKIHYAIIMVLCIVIDIAVIVMTSQKADMDNRGSAIAIVVVVALVVLAFITAFFLLFLWIIKGALKAVESLNSTRMLV
ncbi:uncharacterized protein LOC129739931 [Uranotaenia lowii]|uniref:uncharacterized protein LOC129739931 n=1 Tax=Uranotaenia lowii TaxID=190385 RepID=UPI00247ACDE1|nr:uncharacterized protein LOC129739931 [Uranotaenia lowii]